MRHRGIGQVSTHSRPKAAGYILSVGLVYENVSTHSRPKAAGNALNTSESIRSLFQLTAARRRLGQNKPRGRHDLRCFNSQPPEGGWNPDRCDTRPIKSFNSQPPEGGWMLNSRFRQTNEVFQLTAARRRLESGTGWTKYILDVSTHSRPKAAGNLFKMTLEDGTVSTHSRPKAAGS